MEAIVFKMSKITSVYYLAIINLVYRLSIKIEKGFEKMSKWAEKRRTFMEKLSFTKNPSSSDKFTSENLKKIKTVSIQNTIYMENPKNKEVRVLSTKKRISAFNTHIEKILVMGHKLDFKEKTCTHNIYGFAAFVWTNCVLMAVLIYLGICFKTRIFYHTSNVFMLRK